MRAKLILACQAECLDQMRCNKGIRPCCAAAGICLSPVPHQIARQPDNALDRTDSSLSSGLNMAVHLQNLSSSCPVFKLMGRQCTDTDVQIPGRFQDTSSGSECASRDCRSGSRSGSSTTLGVTTTDNVWGNLAVTLDVEFPAIPSISRKRQILSPPLLCHQNRSDCDCCCCCLAAGGGQDLRFAPDPAP